MWDSDIDLLASGFMCTEWCKGLSEWEKADLFENAKALSRSSDVTWEDISLQLSHKSTRMLNLDPNETTSSSVPVNMKAVAEAIRAEV